MWIRTALTHDTTHGTLLRELCSHGALEQQHASLRGYEARHVRNQLVYRAMRLIPEQHTYQASATAGTVHGIRYDAM